MSSTDAVEALRAAGVDVDSELEEMSEVVVRTMGDILRAKDREIERLLRRVPPQERARFILEQKVGAEAADAILTLLSDEGNGAEEPQRRGKMLASGKPKGLDWSPEKGWHTTSTKRVRAARAVAQVGTGLLAGYGLGRLVAVATRPRGVRGALQVLLGL